MSSIHAALAASKQHNIKMTPRKSADDNATQKREPVASTPKPQPKADIAPQKPVVQPEVVQAEPKFAEPQDQEQDNAPVEPPEAETATTADESAQAESDVSAQKPDPKKANVRPVDISIAGTSHRIICPVDEVRNLEEAVSHINSKVRNLRQEIRGKVPTSEELLVLTCLELYDQIRALQESKQLYEFEKQQATELTEKILKDIRSAL